MASSLDSHRHNRGRRSSGLRDSNVRLEDADEKRFENHTATPSLQGEAQSGHRSHMFLPRTPPVIIYQTRNFASETRASRSFLEESQETAMFRRPESNEADSTQPPGSGMFGMPPAHQTYIPYGWDHRSTGLGEEGGIALLHNIGNANPMRTTTYDRSRSPTTTRPSYQPDLLDSRVSNQTNITEDLALQQIRHHVDTEVFTAWKNAGRPRCATCARRHSGKCDSDYHAHLQAARARIQDVISQQPTEDSSDATRHQDESLESARPGKKRRSSNQELKQGPHKIRQHADQQNGPSAIAKRRAKHGLCYDCGCFHKARPCGLPFRHACRNRHLSRTKCDDADEQLRARLGEYHVFGKEITRR